MGTPLLLEIASVDVLLGRLGASVSLTSLGKAEENVARPGAGRASCFGTTEKANTRSLGLHEVLSGTADDNVYCKCLPSQLEPTHSV